jgi:hypothetical protein
MTIHRIFYNGEWYSYEPQKNKVYVILHGFNGNTEILKENGFDVEEIYLKDYDKYPEKNDIWTGDDINRQKHNLATLVDNIILPRFIELINAGQGPSLVITGSRGGQITLLRLWEYWRGNSICLNGGCRILKQKLENVNLGLITCGNDFFDTSSLQYTIKTFQGKVDNLIIYHNKEDNHGVNYYNEAILHIINKMYNYDVELEISEHAVLFKVI